MLNIIKSVSRKHLPFIILLVIIGGYLFVKALPENSWDGWGFASAQHLMSIKHWTKEGWVNNYFLVIFQGYSKTAGYFDEPELNHHAHGTVVGGYIGQKTHYTHFPPGFFIPYAALGKLGFEQRFWFRWLSIFLSLSALLLLYKFIALVAGRTAAFWGSAFYALSTAFLNFADTIANQPIDDLLKYSILFISFLGLRLQKNYDKFLWLIYFVLSLSSYDSTFFVFAWFLGLDILIKKEWPWKKWLFFASAPILAFVIQIVQNTWYLGWQNMILDFLGAAQARAVITRMDTILSYNQALFTPFKLMLGLDWPWRIIVLIMALFAAGIFYLSKKNKEVLGDAPKILLILFSSALVQSFLVFATALMKYEGRQVAPAMGLLVGMFMAFFFNNIKNITKKSAASLGIVFLILVFLWSRQITNTTKYVKQWPNNVGIWGADESIIKLSKEIKTQIAEDKVGFWLHKNNLESEPPSTDVKALTQYTYQRYLPIPSINEYYLDMPVLGFTNIDDLVRDLIYLRNRSQYPFASVIMTGNEKLMDDVNKELVKKNLLKTPVRIQNFDNRFIIIVPPQV